MFSKSSLDGYHAGTELSSTTVSYRLHPVSLVTPKDIPRSVSPEIPRLEDTAGSLSSNKTKNFEISDDEKRTKLLSFGTEFMQR